MHANAASARRPSAHLQVLRRRIMKNDRRQFLAATAAVGVAAIVPASNKVRADDKKGQEEEVSAPEDLMREHGVLNRILLIYGEGLRRLRAKDDVPPEVFHRPAMLVRKFVEDYHEKLEENFIFPEFEKRQKLIDLVKTLREQHQAGRRVTDVVLRVATADQFSKAGNQEQVVRAIQAFIRMYRPHEAREDTVLFPALHKIMPARELEALGDKFEKEEDRLFGEEGFEKTVDQVAAIEKQLGIYDLSQFTPK
jgi:hemerythrin-like domain-containing protein